MSSTDERIAATLVAVADRVKAPPPPLERLRDPRPPPVSTNRGAWVAGVAVAAAIAALVAIIVPSRTMPPTIDAAGDGLEKLTCARALRGAQAEDQSPPARTTRELDPVQFARTSGCALTRIGHEDGEATGWTVDRLGSDGAVWLLSATATRRDPPLIDDTGALWYVVRGGELRRATATATD